MLKGTTFGDTLGPAMEITDQAEADDYYAQLLELYLKDPDRTPEEAEKILRSNLGYYAGYYDEETQVRVNRLFKTTHPVFGDKRPTATEALQAGMRLGEKYVNKDLSGPGGV